MISWLIEANGFAFFCAKLISISRIAFLLIGVSYKFMFFGILVENEKKPENPDFMGVFWLFSWHPLRGFEPPAYRLGVWRAASYIVRFIICLVV